MDRNAQVTLPQGTIRFHDAGEGEPIVFLHGLLVDGSLWRKVLPPLEASWRCIAPDWPLGSAPWAMAPGADLSPRGVAHLVADFLAELDLEGVTLVANDTGGAIAQLLVTERPQRISRLVLTPCDSYENFLPPAFRPLQAAARVPAALYAAIGSLRARPLRRLPIAYGWLAKRRVPDEVTDAWLAPFLADRGVRRDLARTLSAISSADTLAAAERLAGFSAPTLIAWAPEDRFFPLEHGQRLAATIPDARLELVTDSYTFVSEDQPERLAELIATFMASTEGAPASAS